MSICVTYFQAGLITDAEKEYFKQVIGSPIFPVDFNDSGSEQVTAFTKDEKYLEILKNAAAKDDGDPLEVIPDHMVWLLENVFGEEPRNHVYDARNGTHWKDTMSGYLWHKFGSLGYLTCHQSYKPRQFTHLFDNVR